MQPGCEKFEVTQNIYLEGKDIIVFCVYLSPTACFQTMVATASTTACRHVSYQAQGLLSSLLQVSYIVTKGIYQQGYVIGRESTLR